MSNRRKADQILKGFGKRLRARRIDKGFEHAAGFAKKLGVEEPAYRKYERGQALPRVDVLKRICEELEKPLDCLLFGATNRNASEQESA